MGIREGGGLAERKTLRLVGREAISLEPHSALTAEKRWVDKPACAARLVPAATAKVLATFDDGSLAAIEQRFGSGRAITLAVDCGIIANNVTLPGLYGWWSELLASLGCRKTIDTDNFFVEGGAWHNDADQRLVILINHDLERPQTAKLPDGTRVEIAGGEAITRIFQK